jgi:glucosamine--fructose-6-phosphate aminotransferase (isomerizing)
MCGISVILCKNNELDGILLLLQSLAILQNRGYDSFGSSSIIDNVFNINKVACINDTINFKDFENQIQHIKTNITMGHTRWATHGIISNDNAHPHISNSKQITLVHNGIIENYKELKHFLIEHGYVFYSETDSEVIVNLIDYYYVKESKNIEESIKTAASMLSGTYGLAIQCINNPNNTYLLRFGSPMLVGENDTHIIATSESSGFVNQMKHYYSLKNNDLVILSSIDGIKTSEEYKKIICKEQNLTLTPYPYKHWTEKEIYEQKDSLLRATNYGGRIHNNSIKLGGVDYLIPHLNDIENIILLGCGTSLHVCQIASIYFKQNKCINNINYYDAAEFSIQDLPLHGKSLIIMCSQSGETMDLHRVLKILENNDKCITMGVINVVDSLIAREVDCGIYMNSGREVAVASTKSFTNSLLILYMFSLWIYKHKQNTIIKEKNIESIRTCIEQVGYINENISTLVEDSHINLINKENVFVLGKGKMEFIAKEISLKFKEICYIHAEGYSGSALKHGPFALLTPHFPVILLIDSDNKDKMLNVYKEIESRGADILVISELKSLNIPNVIVIPVNKHLQDILFIVILQHIAYRLSILRNINPDTPRNLAKVVTVE